MSDYQILPPQTSPGGQITIMGTFDDPVSSIGIGTTFTASGVPGGVMGSIPANTPKGKFDVYVRDVGGTFISIGKIDIV